MRKCLRDCVARRDKPQREIIAGGAECVLRQRGDTAIARG